MTTDSDRPIEDDEWGDPIPAPKRRLNAVVSVRFSPSELEVIRSALRGVRLSSFIRDATITAASQHPFTGYGFVQLPDSHSCSHVTVLTHTIGVGDSSADQVGFYWDRLPESEFVA